MRKQLGGGMRQVGVLAAAGLVALETMIPRLAEDHAHARLLARALRACPASGGAGRHQHRGRHAREARPPRSSALAARGVLATAMDARTLRLLTHHDVSRPTARRPGPRRDPRLETKHR